MSLSLKIPFKNVGWNGKLMAHLMCWFGDGKPHKVTRYNSSDPKVVRAILTALKQCGFDGVIVTWQGLTSAFVNAAVQETCRQCELLNMKFALLLDPWAVKFPGKSKEQSLIDALQDKGTQAMLSSKAYIKEKAVLDFSTGANLVAVKSDLAAIGVLVGFWQRHVEYSWPETTNTLGQLRIDNERESMKMPGVALQFFDGGCVRPDGRDWAHSVWDSAMPTRVIPHESGNFYMDQVALVPKAAPYACIVTANDHDEQTDILQFCSMITGIRIGA